MWEKMKKKLQQYWRVLKITKTPTMEEFWAASKISGAGILIVGTIGYIVYLIIHYSYVLGGVVG